MKAKLREDRKGAMQPNETWAMGFVHDKLAVGRKIRMLTIVDTSSRCAPVNDLLFSCRAEDLVQTVERVRSQVGYS